MEGSNDKVPGAGAVASDQNADLASNKSLTIPRAPLSAPPVPPLRHELGATGWVGVCLILLFFGIGGVWAATAPLVGAAIAEGIVSPASSRQTIQHLEGGIIREILVSEGDLVEAGDTLVVLEDLQSLVEVEQLRGRLRSFAATEARLIAVRLGKSEITFDHSSLADRSDLEVQSVIAQQESQFRTAQAGDETRAAILEQRVAQLEQQIAGSERQLEGTRRQLALIEEELVAVRDLVREGLETKPRLLRLQRTEAELVGTEGQLISQIARAREAIGETRIQIVNLQTTRVEEADQELSEIQAKLSEVESQIRDSIDVLSRTVIVAPAAGTILDIRFKNVGGVIRPGEAILDIVPIEDELIIDAKVSPNDRDSIHIGLGGYVNFPSYPQRNQPRIPIEVTGISADAFEDERTGMRYYTAEVKVDRQQLEDLAPEIELTPGLPAQVFIVTSERTALDYILDPVWLSLERAFRET